MILPVGGAYAYICCRSTVRVGVKSPDSEIDLLRVRIRCLRRELSLLVAELLVV